MHWNGGPSNLGLLTVGSLTQSVQKLSKKPGLKTANSQSKPNLALLNKDSKAGTSQILVTLTPTSDYAKKSSKILIALQMIDHLALRNLMKKNRLKVNYGTGWNARKLIGPRTLGSNGLKRVIKIQKKFTQLPLYAKEKKTWYHPLKSEALSLKILMKSGMRLHPFTKKISENYNYRPIFAGLNF